MKFKMCSFILVMILFICPHLFPQDSSSATAIDIEDISLEDLLNTPISVASQAGTTLRESPGIITLITADEIRNSGARDLIDVLRMVPGFNFGIDVQNGVGLMMRGNWAHEGKILLLIDGQEMNELGFATLQFGNHYPLENISRIEIIRGPGSAVYGGNAELGVINIISRSAQELNGFSIKGLYGQLPSALGRANLSASFGKRFGDFGLTASMLLGKANRSDRDFNDFYGNSFNMADSMALKPLHANLGFEYRGLSGRFIMDNYLCRQQDVFFVAAPYDVDIEFRSTLFELKYVWKFNDRLTLTPRLRYKSQTPWESSSDEAFRMEEEDPDSYSGNFSKETITRLNGQLNLTYEFSQRVSILFGLDYLHDSARDDLGEGFNGLSKVQFDTIALYGQALINLNAFNLTLGARYDHHSEFGDSLVPRLALTKVLGRFHFKALFSKAFRAPALHNILDFQSTAYNMTNTVKPENTTVWEFETGYQLSKVMFLTANFYDITMKDPIVYFYDGNDAYGNYERTGTRGMELELRYKNKKVTFNTNLSLYQVNENTVDQYMVAGHDHLYLGSPTVKLAMNAGITLLPGLSVNPSLVWFGKRYGYVGVTDEDDLILGEFDPTLRLNLWISWQNVLTRGLSLGAGVYNLMDADHLFIQPYRDGYHAPMPDSGREILFSVRYQFNFGQ